MTTDVRHGFLVWTKRLVLTGLAVMFAAAVEAVGAVLPDPLVWYKMDEISGTSILDASGNGYDLTLIGSGASFTNLSTAGNALWFDGSTNAFARSKTLPSITNFTVSCWFWKAPADGEWGPGKGNTSPRLFQGLAGLNVCADTGNSNTTYLTSWYGNGGSNYIKPTPSAFPAAWTHFAEAIEVTDVTEVDGRKLTTFNARIYVNGRLCVDKAGLTATNSFASAWMYLGNETESGTRPFCGGMDEMRVWNAALSGEQIGLEFERLPVSTSKMFAWFKMDDAVEDGGNIRVPNRAPFYANFLTANASAVSIVDGWPGKALRFNGTTDTWAYGYTPSAQTRDSTWAYWVKPSKDATVSGNTPRLAQCGLAMDFVAGATEYTVKYSVNGSSTQTVSPGHAGKELWQHWVFVNRYVNDYASGTSSSGVELWVNGVKVHDSGPVFLAADPQIGSYTKYVLGNSSTDGTGKYGFEGDVSEFRIFAGALTSNEIVRLYRGAAKVSAGSDFSTSASVATLCGEVAARASSLQFGYDGSIEWEQIAGPAPAALLRPSNPVTETTLPEDGTYRFRLLCANSFGDVSAATVTVTKVAASSGNIAPTLAVSADANEVQYPSGVILTATVSDTDSAPGSLRTWWEKASGPGGVTFRAYGDGKTLADFTEPGAYVLVCTASDGAVAVTQTVAVTVGAAAIDGVVTNALLTHFAFDQFGKRELVSGSTSLNLNFTNVRLTNSLSGYGLRLGSKTSLVNSGVYFPETAYNPGAGNMPADEWRTVTAWIRPDETPGWQHWAAPIVFETSTMALCYGLYDTSLAAWTANSGFSIAQQGVGGYNTYIQASMNDNFAGKWTHICFVVNRHCTTNSEIYVNGDRCNITKRYVAGNYPNNSTYGEFAGKCPGGRYYKSDGYQIRLGTTYSSGNNSFNNNTVSNTTTGAVAYRAFPGIIDDVRIYGRKLTPGEIRYLAQHPDVDENLAPDVGAVAAARSSLPRGKENAVSASAADDSRPSGVLSYRWQVAAGDASKVVFVDASARETTVTVNAAGTYAFLLAVSDGERTTYGPPKVFEIMQAGTVIRLR